MGPERVPEGEGVPDSREHSFLELRRPEHPPIKAPSGITGGRLFLLVYLVIGLVVCWHIFRNLIYLFPVLSFH